jgi:NAD(P)H-hydrate epimerase
MSLVLDTTEMRAVDQAAVERLGVPALVLMENAGRGVAEAIAARRSPLGGRRVRVVCGAGQNGGDGFVIARHLANRGAQVRVLLAQPRSKVTGAAAVYLAAAERTPDVRVEEHATLEDEAGWRRLLADAEIVVDALFGTGLRDQPRGVPAAAITGMNDCPAWRVAVDIPSGLDADSGRARGEVVRAHLTVTMGALKPGLVLDADAPVGEIVIADLGVAVEPLVDLRDVRALCHYLDQPLVRSLPRAQTASGHKGTRGHALIIAGAPGKTGAAMLCARAAFRAGAGLVTIASNADGQRSLDAKVVEAMTACYAAGADADPQSFDRVMQLGRRMKAAAIGPGIPDGPGMKALVRRLAAELPIPLVLDAEALNLLGPDAPSVLRSAPAPRVLTPHPGEMARLTGLSTAEVQADRLRLCRQLAAATRAAVVLKGARTVIALADGPCFINPAADPSLGTAGSGDVLTGVLTGLLAQGLAVAEAAPLGVYAHGEAGADAARLLGSRYIVAGELPEAIARMLERYLTVDQAHLQHRPGGDR